MKALKILGLIFGVALFLFGIGFGLYVGVWVCFIGGIVDIINQIQTPPVEALALAIGIAKFLFASMLGVVAGGVPACLGVFITAASAESLR